MVNIAGSPRNTSFFQGLALTFTCSITLDAAVDTSVTVQGTWNRNRTELFNETVVVNGIEQQRIAISNSSLALPLYQTTLTFNPINNVTDPGTYECIVTVSPQDTAFVTGSTSSNSRNITVTGILELA